MMRNDYRRALILLRSNAPGYSGHVRLERRTLMGSMYFLLQAPSDCPSLRAALVGRARGGYYACDLGEFRRDARGQAVLGHNFDPRDVCGRELERYQLIAVVCPQQDCRVLLYGNVSGYAELNWERARTALCGLYAQGPARGEAPPASDLPEPEAAQEGAAEENVAEAEGAAEAESAAEEPAAEGPMEAGAAEAETPEAAAAAERPSEAAAESESPSEAEASESAAEEAPRADESAAPARPAIELLEVDPLLPWPEGTEALRALFATLPPMENPPDGEYVYVAAPMPEGSGYPFCASGVRAQGGEIVSVRYALPAAWTQEPPAGLEGHTWVGDQNCGWWLAEVAL